MAMFVDSRFLPILCRLTHRIYRNSFRSVLQLQHTNLSKCKARHLCLSYVLQKENQNKISDKEDPPNKNVSDVSEELTAAAKEVAKSLPGDPLKTQSQLLQRLQAHNVLSESQKTSAADTKSSFSIENIFAGIRVIKEKASYTGNERKTDFQTPPMKRQIHKKLTPTETESMKLFSGPGLGMFSKVTHPPPVPEKKSLWDEINEETLTTISALPSNAFEEMAIWTKEGKYWTFPINNEAGWEDEMNTGFHEHVFLQDLIADFPAKGPIRHFMELVITGLSMSPYLTVQQKKDHISWFKNYFEEKRYLLKEEMALK